MPTLWRVRSRGKSRDLGTVVWSIRNPDGQEVTRDTVGPFTMRVLSEHIKDVATPPRYVGQVKPVWHVRYENSQLSPKRAYKASLDGWMAVPLRGMQCPTDHCDVIGGVLPFSGQHPMGFWFLNDLFGASTMDDLIFQAVESWRPMPREMDLANDLLEVRDLKALALSFKRLYQDLRRVSLYSRRVFFRLRDSQGLPPGQRIAVQSTDGTVNAFLAYNFGVKPLIQSVFDLADAYYAITKRLDFLRKTKGKEVSLTYRRVFPYGPTPPPQSWGSTNESDWYRARGAYTVVLGTKLFHELEVEGYDALIRAFGAYAGFNRPFRVAWNAIPFSFVVDWVYKMSESLDQIVIPGSELQGTYRLRDTWSSVKLQGNVDHLTWTFPQYGNGPVHGSTTRVDAYMRLGGIPEAIHPVTGLSWTQQLLAAALAWQHAR